jgi:hypothetical protein
MSHDQKGQNSDPAVATLAIKICQKFLKNIEKYLNHLK